MKLIILLSILSTNLFASVHRISPNTVYQGFETYNNQPTGNICYITIKNINNIKKGKYCYDINFLYNSIRSDIPKSTLTVQSRITNYHRREYPSKKTCAMNIDGTTYGDEIYGDDTTDLYIQILGGAHIQSKTHYDYFLGIDPDSKDLSRARVHIMTKFKEYNIDCLDLEKM